MFEHLSKIERIDDLIKEIESSKEGSDMTFGMLHYKKRSLELSKGDEKEHYRVLNALLKSAEELHGGEIPDGLKPIFRICAWTWVSS